MNRIFAIIKKLIPKKIFRVLQPGYHYVVAFLGALIYCFPSHRMYVIGITGTKGKTTTANLVAHILNNAGQKTGFATTVNFGIGNETWPNKDKQTMLGRFKLQRLLKKMTDKKCKYAIIETSSEGILQFRHRFINYRMAAFLNLSPEHIERHGGFENYRAAKIKLFEKIAKSEKDGIGIYNLDDENSDYFLKPNIKNKFGFTFRNKNFSGGETIAASNLSLSENGISFSALSENFHSPLLGRFNSQNILAAITIAHALGIENEKIKEAIKNFFGISGRFEIVKENGLTAIIDYAHEPASLKAAYGAVVETGIKKPNSRMICLLGGQGGGRDRWKRSEMGKIASEYCDRIILANEDPYDEDPQNILNDVEKGISEEKLNDVYKIVDREQAIEKAFSLAKENDVLIFTGKGGESSMAVKNGKFIPWNERKIVLEKIKNGPHN